MSEAVIVATARSPIGRASRESLVECRPDDLTATIVRAVLAKLPQLDPGAIEDLLLGCGEPAGESGFNLARVVAILAGMPDVPGVTVNRYCSSSLQTIRMAFHFQREIIPITTPGGTVVSKFVQTNMSQQTLICLQGQFDKRFSQRSSSILALAHNALTERQGLPSITGFSAFV